MSNLGEGAHGSVVSHTVAIKTFYKKAHYIRELKILKLLEDCDRIVKVVGFNPATRQIMLQRCSDKSLEHVLAQVHDDTFFKDIWNAHKKSWWKQCHDLCQTLLQHHIYHNDFKAKNILFRLNADGITDYSTLILIDFSDCKFSDHHSKSIHVWDSDIEDIKEASKEAILARQINDGISFTDSLKSFK